MAEQFYAACYYYDSAPKYNNNNPHLMFQAPLRNNWFWSIDSGFHDFYPKYTELTGQLTDGIFIENELTKEEFEIRAQKSISEGRPLYPSKPSYQLLEYTAIKGYLNSHYTYPMHSDFNFPKSIENLTDIFFYEYPIHFAKSENKSRIKKMMIFGDSLSDNGILKLWLKVMPEFPYWFGRFTDGITWSEYLRKSANITMSNWAIGGAKSGNINDFSAKEILEYVKTEGRNFMTGSVSNTIDRYLQNCLTNGSTIDQKTAEDTIFVIWIGANDYLEKFDNTNTFLQLIDHPNEPGGYEEVSSRAVENIVANIKKLNDKGARYFLIPNLPDIGMTPTIATTPYDFSVGTVKTRAELSTAMSNVIKTHNKKLNEYLSLLAKERQEQLTILYVDIFTDFNMLLQNKNPFNETDFDPQFRNEYHDVYVGNSDTQRIPKKCFQGGYTDLQSGWSMSDWINYASTNTCLNLNQSYNSLSTFWDNVHPTSYAHSFIAYSFHYHMQKAGLLTIEPPEIERYRQQILASYFHQ